MGPYGLPREGVFVVINYVFNKVAASCDQMWANIPQLAIGFGAISVFVALTVSVARTGSNSIRRAGKD